MILADVFDKEKRVFILFENNLYVYKIKNIIVIKINLVIVHRFSALFYTQYIYLLGFVGCGAIDLFLAVRFKCQRSSESPLLFAPPVSPIPFTS